jgi:hypothetical protein
LGESRTAFKVVEFPLLAPWLVLAGLTAIILPFVI